MVCLKTPQRGGAERHMQNPLQGAHVLHKGGLCPSSLSAVLALVPLGVAPAFCVCVAPPPVWWRSWLPMSRTPSCPTRLPPPYEDFTSPYDVDCPVRGWLFTTLLPPPWRAPPGARGAAPRQERQTEQWEQGTRMERMVEHAHGRQRQ